MDVQKKTVLSSPAELPLLGDHPAMDLLNTEMCVDGRLVDSWQSADDVLKWLDRSGIRLEKDEQALDGATFLSSALSLRAIARKVIEQRKAGEAGWKVYAAELNVYLHGAVSTPHLDQDSDGNLLLTRRSASGGAAYLLGALAEAVAQLLVDGQFDLVKQCEHPECILWFYDRTKSHKRRWCSMALCGNRYKAAQFRKRSQQAV